MPPVFCFISCSSIITTDDYEIQNFDWCLFFYHDYSPKFPTVWIFYASHYISFLDNNEATQFQACLDAVSMAIVHTVHLPTTLFID